jgi:hypothetical protein
MLDVRALAALAKHVHVEGVTEWECFVWSSGYVEELQILRFAQDDKRTEFCNSR